MLNRKVSFRFIVVIIAFFVITLAASSASAQQRFVAQFTGAQETPPSGSAGVGYGVVTLNAAETMITVDGGFSGLGTAASAGHIHTAPVGVPGGVTFGFVGVPAATSGIVPQQTFAITPAQVTDLKTGQMYFNIHSGGFPGGEIRGQLLAATCDTAGPIEVEATAGTIIPTAFASLNAAFTAINAGTHQGTISVEVCGNTAEAASAILNSGAVLPAVYSSVYVSPAGAARTVTGSIVGAIIKLNGADNVTVDGRQNGIGTNRDLTVSNTNTSAATAAIWLASVAAGNGVTNDIIRNLELATGIDTTTSGNSTFGIIMCGITIGTAVNGVDNDNNSFIANRIIKARYGIVTRGTTTDLNISPVVTDNIIGPTAFGTDQISKVGILMQADTGATVSRNTVQFVGCLDPQACTGADRMGIAIGNESWSNAPGTITSNTYTVTRNMVHDVVEEVTFSAVGINLATTGGGVATSNLVANNFIYNVRANGTAGDATVGLGIAGGHTDTVANNSISLTGDVDPGAAGASTMYGSGIRIANASGASHANLTLQNNSVYMDLSSSSTAANRYYPISGNSAAYAFGTGGENFNNYYINPANTQLMTGGLGAATGSTLAAQFATLVLWQAAYTAPQDAASIQANPLHVSPTADLHITGASPNIDVGATIAAVAVDIDSETRPNGAAYEIGADEFYPAPGILQLSSMTYGGNEGTTLVATVNRVSGSSGTVGVTATLTDGSGTGGAACGVGVDYVNPGPQLLSFGDTVTSQPINVMLCTDAVTDPGETFTITLSLPTGGATLGTPTVATATITDVPPPFSGSYTVGTGGTYPSLTNTGGIFEGINLGGASGPVTINIISNLTGETGTHPLNPITGGHAVLIKPSGGPRTITGSAPIAVVRLNGADNIRIDGSTAASFADDVVGGNPALRELTIENTSGSGTSAVVAFHSGADGAMNNAIQNVNVDGTSPTTTLLGIHNGGAAVGTAGIDNDGNDIINCRVRRAFFGIYSVGAAPPNQNVGTIIRENEVSSATAADRIRRGGILVFNEDGILIDQNSVTGIDNTGEGADAFGIGVGTQAISEGTLASGGIVNAMVTRNRVSGVSQDATFSAAGIAVAGGNTGPVTLANNMVSGVISDANAGDIVAGIFVVGTSGSNHRLYHNSVSMTGDRSALLTPGTSMLPSYALAITGADPVVDLKNNIFYNSQVAEAVANPGALSFGIGMTSAAFTMLDSNFNDFHSIGLRDGGFRTTSLGLAGGVNLADLTAWNAATGDDPAPTSQEVDPIYINPANDLHLNGLTTPLLGDGGIGIGLGVVDFDNDPRPASPTAPEIGADELVQAEGGAIPAGTFYNAIGSAGDTLGGNVTVTNALTLTGIVNAGANTLTLGCFATVTGAGAGSYVMGNFAKDYCATGMFTYPVGNGGYTPVDVNVTAGTFLSTLSVESLDGTLAGFLPATSLSRNWRLNETGDLTADLSFTYLDPGDVNGNEADYRVYSRNAAGVNTNHCPGAPCVNTGTDMLGPVVGVTNFSRWTGAELQVPTSAAVSLGGRVMTSDGRGIRNARIVVTGNTLIQPRVALTGSFGYFTIDGLQAGETYVVTVNSKRFTFQVPSRVISLVDNVTDVDFIADPLE